jgi:hypothetical protein
MKPILNVLRDIWREIDRNPPCAPPECHTGGGIAFIVWFGGFGLLMTLGLLRLI